ncbi:uncharacterized protein LOC135473275 [Liolophura sinensis]|uniref:uncharacterized protein LOC135473275 n=1 Tax=Liolophura sinensis TaxID=3198878 RepID=UPI0031587F26
MDLGQKYEQFREHQVFYNKTTLAILNSTQDLLRSLTQEYDKVREETTNNRRSDGLVEDAINEFLQTLQKIGYLTVPLLDLHIEKLKDQYSKDQSAIIGLATNLVIIGRTFPANISNIDRYLSAIKSTLSDLTDVTRTLKGKLSAIAKQYKEEEIDKTDMASIFDSNAIRSSLEKLRTSFRHLTSRFDSLLAAGISVRNVIYPVENGTKDVDFDLEWLDFPNLQREAGTIKDCLEGIVSNVTDYQNDLKEYLKGNKLDENFYVNNYLHLEVYFTELSETKITQHQSYSFFDLTCDIGGTLALYTGICILTIFETVDFIFNHVLCPSL